MGGTEATGPVVIILNWWLLVSVLCSSCSSDVQCPVKQAAHYQNEKISSPQTLRIHTKAHWSGSGSSSLCSCYITCLMAGFKWRCDYSCHHCLEWWQAGFQLDATSVCDFWQLAIILRDIIPTRWGKPRRQQECNINGHQLSILLLSVGTQHEHNDAVLQPQPGWHSTSAVVTAPVIYVRLKQSNLKHWGRHWCSLAIFKGCDHAYDPVGKVASPNWA